MNAFISLIYFVVGLYIYILIGSAVVSWMLAFNLLNVNSSIVQRIHRFLRAATEPALAPIKRFVPIIGGIDISPLILILLLVFARDFVVDILNG